MGKVAVAAVGLAGGLAGCATLDRGTSDKLYVLSDPSGAKATLSSGATCTTPCGLDVGRRDALTVTIEKAGYEPRTVTVKTRLNAFGVGDFMENVASGGVGMVVDTATGATLEHSPNPVRVALAPVAPPPAAKGRRTPVD